MEELVIARLLATAGVTALAGQRVEPGRRTQGSPFPSIVVNRISGEPMLSDDEPGADELTDSRIQIDCWAETYAGAKLLARAVRAALRGYSTTAIGSGVHFTFPELERDFNETGANQADYPFRVNLEFNIWHTEGA
jgi:hypothetical protein